MEVEKHLFLVLASFLAWEQFRCNVRDDTTLRDNDIAKELIQLLIVADRELEMAGNDTGNDNTMSQRMSGTNEG